jgi:hypothetical protein
MAIGTSSGSRTAIRCGQRAAPSGEGPTHMPFTSRPRADWCHRLAWKAPPPAQLHPHPGCARPGLLPGRAHGRVATARPMAAASRTTDSCGRGMGRGPTPRPPTCWSQNGWSVKKGTTTVAPRPTTRCGWCQHRRDGRPRPYEETASRAGPGRPPGPRRRGQRWPAGRPSPATASPGSRPGRSAATVSWASATASRSVMLPKPT